MSNPKDEMCCGEVAEVVLVAIYLQPDPPKLLRWATRDSRMQRRLHYSKSLSKPQTQKTRQKAIVENTNVEQGNKVTPARRRLIPHGQNRYKISVFVWTCTARLCLVYIHMVKNVDMVHDRPDTDRSRQNLQCLCLYTKRQDNDVVKHIQQVLIREGI